MDIRVIDGEGNVINVSRMHIKTNGQYLVALTEDMKSTITIERCKDEGEATQFLRWIKEAIKCSLEEESDNVLIDLESEQAGKKINCKAYREFGEIVCEKCDMNYPKDENGECIKKWRKDGE